MKFAKKLQDELYAEWYDEYIDYKMMKKVLKKEHEEAISIFCSALEGQLHKVHAFMCGRQQAISQDIVPLELELGVTSGSSSDGELMLQEAAGGRCTKLVEHIQRFREFAFLNHEAIRKIIKKFDKRFQMDFSRAVGLPNTADLLVNERDICTWLLDPAQHVLRLMQAMVQCQHGTPGRPLRQCNFWVKELQAGIEMARLHVSGEKPPDPTALRLHFLGDQGLRIRNTFIDVDDGEEEDATGSPQHRRRSHSIPPRLKRLEFLQAGSSRWETPETGSSLPSYVSTDDGDRCQGEGGRRADASPSSPTDGDRSMGTPEGGCFDGLFDDPSFAAGFGSKGFFFNTEDDMHSRQQRAPRPQPSASTSVPQGARRSQGPAAQGNAEFSGGRGQRWWSQLRDICPISGFPVALLPYPPFKLQVRPADGSKPISRFIDGPFLALSMLVTWKFEAGGSPMSIADINALDAYMRRCKLGPFRIGGALELYGLQTRDSLQELEALRSRAARRLDVLKHVQRVRLEREQAEAAQQTQHLAQQQAAQQARQDLPQQQQLLLLQQWLVLEQLRQQQLQQFGPSLDPQAAPHAEPMGEPAPEPAPRQQRQRQPQRRAWPHRQPGRGGGGGGGGGGGEEWRQHKAAE